MHVYVQNGEEKKSMKNLPWCPKQKKSVLWHLGF